MKYFKRITLTNLSLKFSYNYIYKFSFLFFFTIFLEDYILKLNFFNSLLKTIFFFLKKKNNLNIFFFFKRNYFCFRFINNKLFIIKYLKFFSWNMLNNTDLIININNYISKYNLIFKKNIPIIVFSNIQICNNNNYSFVYLINIKYIYIFFLLILFW